MKFSPFKKKMAIKEKDKATIFILQFFVDFSQFFFEIFR